MRKGSSRPGLAAAFAACVSGGAVTTIAHAHNAPSPDSNNRYLKVELGHGAARLAFTIYFGELPGARQRRILDRDHDGTIGPAEATAFGQDLQRQIAGSILVELDGSKLTSWTVTDVGLGTPAVTGGAFSIDLELRTPATAGEHTLWIEDHLDLPTPGEAVLHVEPAPEVTMLAAHEGRASAGGVRLEAVANGRPVAGTTVRWREATEAPAAAPVSARPRRHLATWAVALAVFAALGGVVAVRRRRTGTGSGPPGPT